MTDDSVLDAQRAMWAAGDYPAIAQRLLPISLDLLDAVGVSPGDRVLDVGVGDGNTAVEAARRGAVVTGVDLTPEQIAKARARAEREEVDLDLAVGNAERLDLPDDAFDTVVSVMGVIFAPDHRAAVAELARVCRPGGTVALTSWVNEGWFQAWRARAADLLPPPPEGGPDPDAWGDPAEVVRRMDAAGLSADVTKREFHWTFPSPADGADFFLRTAGPFIAFQAAATEAGQGDKARDVLVEAIDSVNEATDGTCRAAAPYLLTIARHRS